MSQADLALIKAVITGLNVNRISNFAYTDEAFDNDDVNGVEVFDVNAAQNIPLDTKTEYNDTILGKGARTQVASLPRGALNHFFGRPSYNINKLIQKFLEFLTLDASRTAHNANEYDSTAEYATGDYCYAVENNGNISTYTLYKRVSTNPTKIQNIPVTNGTHWREVLDKGSGFHKRYAIADLTSGYATNTWYPVVTDLQDFESGVEAGKDAALRVQIEAYCNGAVNGFANAQRCDFVVQSKFTGFAASSTDILLDSSMIDQVTGTDNSGSALFPIKYTKLHGGRQAVLWLRGGAKYALYNSFGSKFTLYTSAYNNGIDAAVSPSTSVATALNNAQVTADFTGKWNGLDAAQFVYGGGSHASNNVTNADTIAKSGFYVISTPWTGAPTATDYDLIHIQGTGVGYSIQIASSRGASPLSYIRSQGSSAWGSWYKLWSQANDGTGSGLDADLFDGIDSVRFIFGDDGRVTIYKTSGSCNDLLKSGFYTVISSVTDRPPGAETSYHILHQQSNTDLYAVQIATGLGGTGVLSSSWIRTKNNGSWSAWVNIWNGGNDGAGSGLDADLFDAMDSTRFMFGDNARGTTVITDADAPLKSGLYQLNSPFTNAPSSNHYKILHAQYSDNDGYATQIAMRGDLDNLTYVRTKVNGTWFAWVKLWNGANDGAGSGLDADLIDGIDSVRIPYGANLRATTDLSTGDLNGINKSGFYSYAIGAPNAPTGTAGHLLHIQYVSTDASSAQLAFLDDFSIYTRRKSAGTYSAWVKVWTGATDGSGSGLDADFIRGTTPGAGGLLLLALSALGSGWVNALDTTLGTGWVTALETTVGAQARAYLTKDTQAQMAAQILADLLTVDGPGSGLDADTVDTIPGDEIVSNGAGHLNETGRGGWWATRTVSDATTPWVKILTLDTTGLSYSNMGVEITIRSRYITSKYRVHVATGNLGSSPTLHTFSVDALNRASVAFDPDQARVLQIGNVFQLWVRSSSYAPAGARLDVVSHSSNYAVLTKHTNVTQTDDPGGTAPVVTSDPRYKTWNSGNDGSGSGLDADLIRGTTPGANWLTAIGAALGSGWTTALAAAVGAQARTYLTKDTQATMAALILADLKTVDGVGSGLDADTVDGYGVTNAGDGVKVKHGYFISDSVLTVTDLFNSLSASIPNIGDWVSVSGFALIFGVTGITKAKRTSATVITLSTCQISSGNLGEYSVTQGSAVVLNNWSLSW